MKVLNVKNSLSEFNYYRIRVDNILDTDGVDNIHYDLRKLNISIRRSVHNGGFCLPSLIKDYTKESIIQGLILGSSDFYNNCIRYNYKDIYLSMKSCIEKCDNDILLGYKTWWLESLESSIVSARKEFEEEVKKYKKTIDNILKHDIIK